MATKTDRKPRREDEPRADNERDKQASVIEESAESADGGRDLVHGEGGTIDRPTRPGDLSKDD
jgi:hypothetical protein